MVEKQPGMSISTITSFTPEATIFCQLNRQFEYPLKQSPERVTAPRIQGRKKICLLRLYFRKVILVSIRDLGKILVISATETSLYILGPEQQRFGKSGCFI